jgi:DNA topoisomerase VI subunit B
MPHTFERTTFETSRLLEFFSDNELAMQMGCPKEQWPIALLKELIDNALDACEGAGLPPEIEVTVEPDLVHIRDHGPGLSEATLTRSLDYVVRVSDKAHYVSPTRGQQGNALKSLWAAPYVASGEAGYVEVVTGGMTHRIAVTLDRISQAPALRHTTTPDGFVKDGTCISLIWPEIASLAPSTLPIFYKGAADLVLEYGAFNPHATLRYHHGDRRCTIRPTMPDWEKWRPHDPTSPHWYTPDRLRTLIAAYLTHERRGGRARTVREFVAEFRGLSGTAKQKAVTTAAGLSGAYLHDLVEDDDVALLPVTRLLSAMQRASRQVKADALGVLGERHLASYLVKHYQAEPASLKYRKLVSTAAGLPFVVEVACAFYTADGVPRTGRRTLVGINWTPALKPPFAELPALLGEARVDARDPVIVLAHVAIPRVDFTDRGKGAAALPLAVREALASGIMAVTKHWTGLKRQADRAQRVRARDQEHWLKQQQRQFLSIKEAAYQVMEDAYQHASAQGRYPANARQIMYAARPDVLELTGGKCWKRSSYFTQELLPDFIEEHPDLTATWDVVFDDRGHLIEPHTQHRIGLGTLAVRDYIGGWHAKVPTDVGSTELDHDCPTMGPVNRHRFVLFLEKEGFYPLLEVAQIAERYDIAIMSTKGMSVTAARRLVDDLSQQGVTVLVCHDLDKSGFSILHTLRTDTRRYTFQAEPKVVDLGLRLADVQSMDLQSEPVSYLSGVDPRLNLRACGATPEECDFLVQEDDNGGWIGQRVELNAMTSDQFIAWLEQKLADAGVKKVVPDQAALENAYRRAVRQKRFQAAIEAARAALDGDEEIAVPSDLEARIREQLEGSAQAWDHVLWDLVDDESEDEDSEDSDDDESLE